MLRLPSLVAGLCAGVFAAPWLQDPVKPAQTPPVTAEKPAAPAPTAGEKPGPLDVAGRPKANALEGVYRLTARVIDGKHDRTSARGYLAITGRHVFLQLAAPGPSRDTPLVRAGVRSWQQKDEVVEAKIELGWFTDKEGTLHVEPPGTDERRRFQFIQGGLRVIHDDRNWLEFERVE